MFFRQIYNDQLAQASYLVGCQATGEALVVDPNRDLDRYLALAAAEGLRITAVTETHIHADFVSGARELAARAAARLYLSGTGPAAWRYAFAEDAGGTLLHDGDVFMVGNVRLEVLHTPGHTPESVSFLLTDTAASSEPMGIFTGDFVFVGDVGRPDLLERAAGMAGTKEAAARQLYRSLRRFATLPEHLQVWPGHGAGSACGKALGAVPQSTVGYEMRTNWGLQPTEVAGFVANVLAGQPEPPPYFARMKQVNVQGPTPVGDPGPPARLTLASLRAILATPIRVVDIRAAERYSEGHIPGTINIPLNNGFLRWAGWLLPHDRPLALIGDEGQIRSAIALLRLIGLDVTAVGTPDILAAWQASGERLGTIDRIDVERLRQLRAGGKVAIIDVRMHDEYLASHIPGSTNLPLGTLPDHLDVLPAGMPLVVHCQGGTRSAIAASMLHAYGYLAVDDLPGGFLAWKEANKPVEGGVSMPPLVASAI